MSTSDTPLEAAPARLLFDLGPADQPASATDAGATPVAPRLRRAERHQMEFRPVVLDKLVDADHAVRIVWDYVCGLDLAPVLQQIQAVAGKPGRDSTDPRILLCLWLYATLEGIGSARELDRRCSDQLPFMWICGGVSVNYHLLADFRAEQARASTRS